MLHIFISTSRQRNTFKKTVLIWGCYKGSYKKGDDNEDAGEGGDDDDDDGIGDTLEGTLSRIKYNNQCHLEKGGEQEYVCSISFKTWAF